jgi:putative nucleotidyltransferase with HDIG domain
MVRTLVLGFSLAQRPKPSGVSQDHYRLLWRQSLTQACLAESIACRDAGLDESNWFLAALLQDIGQLALLNFDASSFPRLISSANSCRIEEEVFGFNHVDLSLAMCRKWNFEAEILEAIATHHDDLPFLVGQSASPARSLQVALAVASRGSQMLRQFGEGNSTGHEGFFQIASNVYSMSHMEIQRMLLDVEIRVDEVAITFGIDIGETPSVE